MSALCTAAVVCVLLSQCAAQHEPIIIDDSPGVGRIFDGIGGLSGGGVSFPWFKFTLVYLV